ncbi:MAG: DUF302 domain-containing protein [Sulfurimonadaceae bacterium]|nr:DUF302 domain-containing protein [Sulfurimonadaceae bacterium]
MRKSVVTIVAVMCLSLAANAAEGMINVQSSFNVKETAERLLAVLEQKKMTLFVHVKHSEGAEKVGLPLCDTELVIFGNPKVGTPLMQCEQSVAIDLPQKALIWEDEKGSVWLSYNDPRYIEKRHDVSGCEAVIAKIEKALAGITKAATAK